MDVNKIIKGFNGKARHRFNSDFRYVDLGSDMSVYNRSLTCDIELPEYSSISTEEEGFPLAYAITAYMDSRNLELLLASIFRPHNSYCLHIDPFSDELFR